MSVVLATRDAGRYLDEAVGSILAQTERDLELIVVDDGTTDGSVEALATAHADPRLVVVRAAGDGLTAALRIGMARATGTFVARMDADDCAQPTRLERQVALLQRDPALGIVGAACTVVDGDGAPVGTIDPPLTPLAIRWRALLENPFVHPTVVLRGSLLRDVGLEYDKAFRTAQDYELWTRVLEHADGANTPERLLSYRVHAGAITSRSRESQLAAHTSISLRTIRRRLPGVAIEESEVVGLRRLLVERSVSPGDGTPLPRLVRAHHTLLAAFAAAGPAAPGIADLVDAERRRLALALWSATSSAERLALVRADRALAPLLAGCVASACSARLRRLLRTAP